VNLGRFGGIATAGLAWAAENGRDWVARDTDKVGELGDESLARIRLDLFSSLEGD
jgi:hypothetical protein